MSEQEYNDDLEEEVEEEEVEEEEQEELSDEQRAEMVGWDPEFKGPGAKSAKEFLSKREEDLGLANANIRQLESKVDRMSKFLTSAQQRAEEQGYQRAMAEIKQRQREAVRDGDEEAFDAAEKEEEELKEEYEKNRTTEQEQPDNTEVVEVVKAYRERYPDVFETRSQAEDWIGELQYAAANGAKTWQEAADKATRAVSRKYNLGSVPGPEDTSSSKGGGKKKGFNALPKEAKADFRQFQKDNPDLDKEEYARIYFEEFGDE